MRHRKGTNGGVRLNRKWVAGVLAAFAVLAICLTVWGMPLIRMLRKPDQMRAYLAERGSMANLVFFAMVVLQVISGFFPAGPFQMAAGYLYGPVRGCLLYDAYAAIGCGTAWVLARTMGRKLLTLMVEEGEIRLPTSEWSDTRAKESLFLVYLVPGMPKDLAPYAAGLSGRVSFARLMVSALAGRLPSIFLTVMGGDSLASGNLKRLLILMIVILASSAMGKMAYERKQEKKR
ncbi:TVP38/TMEM64 family protein [Chordicoccus furentiruminis]|uniref:TVP38/TMEM64 family protein n=1 Tax=Chordicoccus furentiruminis TaxID=2709410 RepID=UPI0023A90525|nr:VTT domain-containing protein [Chordicoccus furentiruminis]